MCWLIVQFYCVLAASQVGGGVGIVHTVGTGKTVGGGAGGRHSSYFVLLLM